MEERLSTGWGYGLLKFLLFLPILALNDINDLRTIEPLRRALADSEWTPLLRPQEIRVWEQWWEYEEKS